MFSEKTEKLINEAVVAERDNAMTKWGKTYHSIHEGYAVLKEEVEETEEKMEEEKYYLQLLWDEIKNDCDIKTNRILEIKKSAIHIAKEACQVAAVCDKICITLGGDK